MNDRHAIGQSLNFGDIMRRHKHAPAFLLGQFQHAANEFIPHERVQAGKRFVQHHQFGPVGQT